MRVTSNVFYDQMAVERCLVGLKQKLYKLTVLWQTYSISHVPRAQVGQHWPADLMKFVHPGLFNSQ